MIGRLTTTDEPDAYNRPLMAPETYELCEAVADLSAMFASPHYAPVVPDDSRNTVTLVIAWAAEFTARNLERVWDGEYIEEIEDCFRDNYNIWKDSAQDVRIADAAPKNK